MKAGRDDVADGVDDDRVGRGERGDQAAGHARPRDLRERDRELQLRVALDQILPLDERGQVRLVRDVEEDGEDPDHELHDEQLPDREHAERVGDRDRREQHARGRRRRRSGSAGAACGRPRRPRVARAG